MRAESGGDHRLPPNWFSAHPALSANPPPPSSSLLLLLLLQLTLTLTALLYYSLFCLLLLLVVVVAAASHLSTQLVACTLLTASNFTASPSPSVAAEECCCCVRELQLRITRTVRSSPVLSPRSSVGSSGNSLDSPHSGGPSPRTVAWALTFGGERERESVPA